MYRQLTYPTDFETPISCVVVVGVVAEVLFADVLSHLDGHYVTLFAVRYLAQKREPITVFFNRSAVTNELTLSTVDFLYFVWARS